MSRVRANDYEDKRQLILDQAAALIASRGFELATMLDLAQACGTSKSLLYHYFPHKEDLLFAIVHDHITRQVADLRRIVALPLPADARFAQFVDSFVQGAAASRHQHLMLMNDLKHLPAELARRISALFVDGFRAQPGSGESDHPAAQQLTDLRVVQAQHV